MRSSLTRVVVWTVLSLALEVAAGVVINEVCWKNDRFDDGTGSLDSDWVELYNNGDTAVDVGGYAIGKKKDYAACGDKLCTLPSYTMAPGEFLVVYFNKDLPSVVNWVETRVGGTVKSVPWVRSNAFGLGTTDSAGAIYQDDVRLFDNTSGHNRLSNIKGEDVGGVLAANTSYGYLRDGADGAPEGSVVFATPTPWSSNAAGFSMPAPTLSVPPGVYASAPTVTLTSSDSRTTTLYYTLDGSDPRTSSTRRTTTSGGAVVVEARAPATVASGAEQTNAWFRTSPPELDGLVAGAGWTAPIGSVPRISPLRVVAVYGPGFSAEAGGSYCIGDDFQSRKLPIVALYGDSADWFSDERGIYVPGAPYAANGYGSGKWGRPNANYFDDLEVPARLELIETAGTQPTLSFDLGFSLLSGGICALPQKALVGHLRGTEYGTRSIDYALFPELGIRTYRRFVLDNGGKDWHGPLSDGVSTMMRGAVFHRLASELDVSSTASRPVSVYLNGDYWGVHQLGESRDKHYFATRYGLNADNIDLLAHEEDSSSSDVNVVRVAGSDVAVDDYQDFLKRVDKTDVATDEGFAAVAAEMDVDNYVDYIIAETFFANGDWPIENCEFWRVHEPESNRADAYGDGRWRWMLSDLSQAGKAEDGVQGAWRDMLAYISTKAMDGIDEPAFLINRLWRNEAFCAQFVARYAKLLNTVFHPDRTSAVVKEEASSLDAEIVKHYRRWGRGFTHEQWSAAVRSSLVDYLALRWTNSFEHLNAKFDLGGVGSLRVGGGEGGEVMVDGAAVASSGATVRGFAKCPITVSAVPVAGKVFAGWSDGVATAVRTVQVVPDSVTALTASFVNSTDRYRIRFDANGGEGTMAEQEFAFGQSMALTACGFTRSGCEFIGWATELGGPVRHADGAEVANLTDQVGATVVLYACWAGDFYTVRYDANGGDGEMAERNFGVGMPQLLDECEFSRSGSCFLGWALSADGDVVYADEAEVVDLAASGTVALYAVWGTGHYTVRYDANGGTGVMADQGFVVGTAQTLSRNRFTSVGRTFAGWSLKPGGMLAFADGDRVCDLTRKANASVTLYAVWAANSYTIEFDANGGIGEMAAVNAVYGEGRTLGAGDFSRVGYVFAGWARNPAGPVEFGPEAEVKDLTIDAGGVVTLYAVWQVELLYPESETSGIAEGAVAPWSSAATVYDGYAFDDQANLRGVLLVKVGKANARTGISKVTATFTPATGTRKLSFRNGKVGANGIVEDMVSGSMTLRLTLGGQGMSGRLGSWGVDGARNRFVSKDRTEKAAAELLRKRFVGGCAVVWRDRVVGAAPGTGWSGFSVAVGSKGKMKVAGQRADGKRFSVTSQLLVGTERCCLPLVVPKSSLAIELWSAGMDWTSGVKVSGLEDWVAGLAGGTFGGTFVDCPLPTGLTHGERPFEGWKPRVNAKTGALKGSFKAYAETNGRLRRNSVAVTGFVVDGVGYGTATVRKRASWAVTLR